MIEKPEKAYRWSLVKLVDLYSFNVGIRLIKQFTSAQIFNILIIEFGKAYLDYFLFSNKPKCEISLDQTSADSNIFDVTLTIYSG
jgi:hypothetical protein